MNNEVKKTTNLEHYKEELKDIFKNNYCYPINMIFRIEHELDRDIKYNETGNKQFTGDILDWMAQPYKGPILDDAERKYLSEVIRPFRDMVESIYKGIRYKNDYVIRVDLKFDKSKLYRKSISFPLIEGELMFKGMEINKFYSLEELGL